MFAQVDMHFALCWHLAFDSLGCCTLPTQWVMGRAVHGYKLSTIELGV